VTETGQVIVWYLHISADALFRIPCPRAFPHCQEVESTVRVTVGTASSVWVGSDVGPVVREVKARQRPKWKDISNRNPIYKNYGAQRIVLVERRCGWTSLKFCQSSLQDSANTHSPSSNQGEKKYCGASWTSGTSGCHQNPGQVRRGCNWLHTWSVVTKWHIHSKRGPHTLMHQNYVREDRRTHHRTNGLLRQIARGLWIS
jgi:hypothetical protein